MNKRYIWIVSIVLGVALLSLIALQLWFFQSARQLKKEQLDLSVNIALNEVVMDLERSDREKRIKFLTRQQGGAMTSFSISHSLFQEETIVKHFSSQNLVHSISQSGDFYNMLPLPIGQRLNFKKLKEHIAKSLRENNVFLGFEYAVKTAGKYDFSSDNFLKNLENNPRHSKILFPSDVATRDMPQSRLIVYFERPNEFYKSDLLRFLIPAAILIFVVVLCSTLTILFIFRQKKVSKIRNDFINNMTHEFKTPISTISLASQMLKDQTLNVSRENVERYSTMISDESKRLSFQVEKILQMAVFDGVQMRLKPKKIQLNAIIEKQLPNFRMNIENRNGSIVTHLSEDLFETLADEVHIGNIIANLLDNALKYSRKIPEITIATQNRNDFIELTIADNGIGIAKQDQKMIFERFYRVHTGNLHNIKGFGLGLSYVKQVVDAHKGTIGVESMLEQGTKFTIHLPIKKNE